MTTNTPEHRMWYAVLNTFIEDMLNKNPSPARFRTLMHELNTEWMEYICSLVDVEHELFCKRLVRLYRAKLARGDKVRIRRGCKGIKI